MFLVKLSHLGLSGNLKILSVLVQLLQSVAHAAFVISLHLLTKLLELPSKFDFLLGFLGFVFGQGF